MCKARELVAAFLWQQRIDWLLPVAWVPVSQLVQQRAKDIGVFSGEGYVGDRQIVISRYRPTTSPACSATKTSQRPRSWVILDNGNALRYGADRRNARTAG